MFIKQSLYFHPQLGHQGLYSAKLLFYRSIWRGRWQRPELSPQSPSRIDFGSADGWWGPGRLAGRILIFARVLGAHVLQCGFKLPKTSGRPD